jgi:hypothetical protein
VSVLAPASRGLRGATSVAEMGRRRTLGTYSRMPGQPFGTTDSRGWSLKPASWLEMLPLQMRVNFKLVGLGHDSPSSTHLCLGVSVAASGSEIIKPRLVDSEHSSLGSIPKDGGVPPDMTASGLLEVSDGGLG